MISDWQRKKACQGVAFKSLQMMMICKRYFTQCWPPTFTEALSFVAGAGVKPTYEWRTEIFGDSIEKSNVTQVVMDRLMADHKNMPILRKEQLYKDFIQGCFQKRIRGENSPNMESAKHYFKKYSMILGSFLSSKKSFLVAPKREYRSGKRPCAPPTPLWEVFH